MVGGWGPCVTKVVGKRRMPPCRAHGDNSTDCPWKKHPNSCTALCAIFCRRMSGCWQWRVLEVKLGDDLGSRLLLVLSIVTPTMSLWRRRSPSFNEGAEEKRWRRSTSFEFCGTRVLTFLCRVPNIADWGLVLYNYIMWSYRMRRTWSLLCRNKQIPLSSLRYVSLMLLHLFS